MKIKVIFLLFFSILLSIPFIAKGAAVINEIAWMGTENWRHEWLELYANESTSLDGWKIELYRDDLDFTIELSGTIENYFLIVASDVIFTNYDFNYSNLGGKLINGGQRVVLKNNQEETVDEVNCFSEEGWFAGNNTTKQTMERVAGGWQTSLSPGGTPKAQNSSGEEPEEEPQESEEPEEESEGEPEEPEEEPDPPADEPEIPPTPPSSNQPPVADAGNNVIAFVDEEITFDGSKSYDPDGDELIFTWNLGEGVSEKGIAVSHKYKYSYPRTHLVTLIVSDGQLFNEDTITVEIYPKKITINEFLPSPAGKDAEEEWIELYNDSDQIVDVSGWQLDDEDGGSKPFVFPGNTLIPLKSYLVLSRQVTGVALNNDGDKVRLLLPTEAVFQEVSYEKAPEGQSSSRTPEGFVWSTPTPGLPNTITVNVGEQISGQAYTTRLKATGKNKQDNLPAGEAGLNYYSLANLEKSTGSNNKSILIIITIVVVAFAVGIGALKLKKKI